MYEIVVWCVTAVGVGRSGDGEPEGDVDAGGYSSLPVEERPS